MVAVAMAPFVLGETSWIYGAAAAILNIVFLVLAFAVFRNQASNVEGMKPEKRLFAFSILYLFALFALFAADRMIFA
jgi:heme o synthase